MSVARTTVKGLVTYDRYRAYHGATLLVPETGGMVWLVDMYGQFLHRWEIGGHSGGYAELLPSGNLLCTTFTLESASRELEGASNRLVELDWNGSVVWEYRDESMHDGFLRTPSGTTMVISEYPLPPEVARRVANASGFAGEGYGMSGDMIREISRDHTVLWEWRAHDHLDPEIDVCCPLCPPEQWPHVTGCVEMPNGYILVCFRACDSIVTLEKKTGKVVRRWGHGQLAHPYGPRLLNNGNILLFDSGYHRRGIDMATSRVLEVESNEGRIVWCYEEDAPQLFYSSTLSNCQRLPNGNTLICEGSTGRVFEVSAKGELIWEFVNHLPHVEEIAPFTSHRKLCAALRYGFDYPGLGARRRKPGDMQSAPGSDSEPYVKRGTSHQNSTFSLVRDSGY
jgi:hypothetical protein